MISEDEDNLLLADKEVILEVHEKIGGFSEVVAKPE